jgi:hypothetical protein
MSSRNWASRRIEQPTAVKNLLPDAGLETRLRDEIDSSTEEGCESVLKTEKGEQANTHAGLELDQQINIAFRVEIGSKHRPEGPELADPRLSAKTLEGARLDTKRSGQPVKCDH